ncbi:unnamed protein product [Meloidogyne enterolobii]|uniref:Uncharacterized protein n=1 Tax=Meloidogyne enterolobii TaxID=390850 RepID=A0ACB0YFY7_MELEN
MTSSSPNSADTGSKIMFTRQDEWKNTGSPDGEIKVFRPTMEEFKNFGKYMEYIEQQNAHLSSGVCKVIPPEGWYPRPSKLPDDYSDIDDFIIECPVRERIESMGNGCHVKNNVVYRKEMKVKDFRRMALSKQYGTPQKNYDLYNLEKHFWRNLLHHEPIYGADTPGSIYDSDVKEFNMNCLGTILDLLKEEKVTIKGVNTVFLYFGMWKTTFPWHAEDMDLYSINYLHFGEPKFWYAIPSHAAEKFERLAAQRFPDGLQICKAFLRHKLYIISPTVLKQNGIPYGTMVQYPGEFIITFPKGYHMGFNTGYNCAESTNFALERWIDYGKNAVLCYCRKDTVEIDMRPFMKKYRPEEYREWFDYWYGERASTYKPTKPDTIKTRKRKGSQDSGGGKSETGSEDSSINLPRSICTKRQRKIFQARKPMFDLWANRPVNLFAEKTHNSRCGKLFPHCCVCQYFISKEIWNSLPPVESLPKSSRRYVTDQMFYKEKHLKNLDLKICEDELLECSNCYMVVHKNCYPCGGTKITPEMNECWLCERCYNRNDVLIRTTSCRLCELRGGALLECEGMFGEGSDFVHVICALMDRGTRFLKPENRSAPFSPPPKRLLTTQSSISERNGSSPNLLQQQTPIISNTLNVDSFGDSGISEIKSPITFTPFQCLSPSQNDVNNTYLNTFVEYKECSPSSSCHSLPIPCQELTVAMRNSNQQFSEYSASYECEVCGQQSEHLIRCNICLSSEEVGAKLRFHITCAPLADVTFERRHYPENVIAVCSFHHSDQQDDPVYTDVQKFQINQEVIVHQEGDDNEENLTGVGRIVGITEHLCATVDFLDGTISGDLFLGEIRNCECKWFGCSGGSHIPGSLVYVDWPDEKIYEAYYRGKMPKPRFKIKLTPPFKTPNDDLIEVGAECIYFGDEQLPEGVHEHLRNAYRGSQQSI